uniref:Uncharacterized protein n=1 Tax=Anguilla anguilla TaxID=7936 RepID=A0A0E9WNS8_ANGAN
MLESEYGIGSCQKKRRKLHNIMPLPLHMAFEANTAVTRPKPNHTEVDSPSGLSDSSGLLCCPRGPFTPPIHH